MYRISVEPMATYGVSERLHTTFDSLERAKAEAERLYALRIYDPSYSQAMRVYRTVAVVGGPKGFRATIFDGEWSR